jgi:hypothetical protein
MNGNGDLTMRWSWLVLSSWAVGTAAFATPLEVVSQDGAVLTVVLDGDVVGETPLVLDVADGLHTLAFRGSAFAPTAFGVSVDVQGAPIVVAADWARQVAASRPPMGAESPPSAGTAAPAGTSASTGDVFVSTDVPGRPIFLDGVPTQQVTPALLSGLSVGKHRIEVMTECERASADVTIKELLVARAELKLEVGQGTLKFTSTPVGATVVIDGREVGRTPVQVGQISCGEHTWAVRLAGYLPFEQSGAVPAFRTTQVAPVLEKERFGTLVLLPDPVDASLWLDGVALGVGPRTVEKVGAGAHVLEGRKEGFDVLTLPVDVPPEAVARVSVVLSPVVTAPVAPPPAAEPSKKSKAPRPEKVHADEGGAPAPPSEGASSTLPSVDVDAAVAPATEAKVAGVAQDAAPEPPGAAPLDLTWASDADLRDRTARPSVPRWVANSLVTAGALTATGLAIPYWLVSRDWYRGYLETSDPALAEEIYVNEVIPRRNYAIVATSLGVGLIGASAALWATTDFTVSASPNGVVLGGRF